MSQVLRVQVWHALHAGRSSGATAAPKYDPIYAILNTANVWSGWGNVDDEWNTSLRYDPVAQLFAAATTAPTVRSKYDVLQVCTPRLTKVVADVLPSPF
jgi:hypothetical protein